MIGFAAYLIFLRLYSSKSCFIDIITKIKRHNALKENVI